MMGVRAFGAALGAVRECFSRDVHVSVVARVRSLGVVVVAYLTPRRVRARRATMRARIRLLLTTVVVLNVSVLRIRNVARRCPSPSRVESRTPKEVEHGKSSLPLLTVRNVFLMNVNVLRRRHVVRILQFCVPFVCVKRLSGRNYRNLARAVGRYTLVANAGRTILDVALRRQEVRGNLSRE